MHNNVRWNALAFFVGVFLLLPAIAKAGGELEKQFAKASSDILTRLRADGLNTVGVLKFSVRIGDGQFPSNVGTLNSRLAEKLEIALVMANPAQKSQVDKQVGVVRGASDVAATIDRATHLADDGRKLLFSKKYPLAWKHRGLTEVVPDALIVGVAQIDADLSQMAIELMLLTQNDLQLSPLASFRVPTDIADLIDGGESFTTRGLFDGGTVNGQTNSPTETNRQTDNITRLVRQEALLTRAELQNNSTRLTSKRHPLSKSSESPVALEIWYGKELQQYEFRSGAAFVKEPEEGQEVILIVRRKGSDKSRYGVLVRVNGENTLYRERSSDAQAALWVMAPNLNAFSIRGYQLDNDKRQQFRVLSQAESEQRRFDYGRDVGLISITVFPERTGLKPSVSDREFEFAVQSEASLPHETKESRGQLGTSLFDQLLAQNTTRGLIANGKNEAAKVDTVEFKRGSVPIMSASVRYYKANSN